jgi:hypothetical protein
MSSSQRRLLESMDLVEGGEIVRFYRHIGKQVPPWLDKGQAGNIDLAKKYLQTDVLLRACGSVIILGIVEGEAAKEISKAVALLKRFQEAVTAIFDMDTKSQKHRDLVLGLYSDAWIILDRQIENGLRLKDYYGI